MTKLRSIGSWIVAVVATLLAVAGIASWWRERKRRQQLGGSAADLAADNARRALDTATAELDTAITRGEAHVAAEDHAADERAKDETDCDLADLLLDADPGPRRRRDD